MNFSFLLDQNRHQFWCPTCTTRFSEQRQSGLNICTQSSFNCDQSSPTVLSCIISQREPVQRLRHPGLSCQSACGDVVALPILERLKTGLGHHGPHHTVKINTFLPPSWVKGKRSRGLPQVTQGTTIESFQKNKRETTTKHLQSTPTHFLFVVKFLYSPNDTAACLSTFYH